MPPVVSLIAAVSSDGYVSRGRGVPWDLPADREHFRACTAGKWLLLGRSTYEEMIGWFSDHHPLVLSSNPDFVPAVGQRVASVAEAIALTGAAGQEELLVCGGSQVYAAALPVADRLILTRVDQRLGGGLPFPAFDEAEWPLRVRRRHPADDQHALAFEIRIHERVRQ
jgi:dihydrofolate reductase